MRARLVMWFVGIGLLVTLSPAWAQEADAGSDALREKNEKVGEILAALEASTALRIADVGSGDGFYSVRIARALPASGRVMAVDVTEKALNGLRQRLDREKVTNVDMTLGAFDSPRLAAEAYDAAFIYNAYHEMTDYQPMLKGILSALKPGGRLVISELLREEMRNESRAAQTAKHQISDELTAQELQAAGFQIVRKDAAFRSFSDWIGPGVWWLIVATKPTK